MWTSDCHTAQRITRRDASAAVRKGEQLRRNIIALSGLAALLAPVSARAHFFIQTYSLPVPFLLYAWGASLTLALSFAGVAVAAIFPARHQTAVPASVHTSADQRRRSGPWGRGFALFLLVICIVTGLIGVQDPYRNISMTLFWVVLVLAVPYLTLACGDFYARHNPWGTLITLAAKMSPRVMARTRAYPSRLACWPGLISYYLLIWLELFGHPTPRAMASALAIYSTVNVVGGLRWGRDPWLSRNEVFQVFNQRIADFRSRVVGARSECATPLAHDAPTADRSAALFILFMLASTAFDGLHNTAIWNTLFWKHIYPVVGFFMDEHFQRVHGFKASVTLFHLWQWATLAVMPLLYLFALATALTAARWLAPVPVRVDRLIRLFAPSLVPIAIAYHVAHYGTSLLGQLPALPRLLSDPFGFGWNLFGTAGLLPEPLMLGMQTLWHAQVGVILAGHLASVALRHRQALRLWRRPSDATRSQLPMLVLMIAFTVFGLWILSLPFN